MVVYPATHPASAGGCVILTLGRGGEGGVEPGITNQHVLGSADVQEEMAEDGTRGQAGLDKAVAWLRAVQYPLPFFLQHDEMVLHQLLFWWSVVCLCSVKPGSQHPKQK